MQRWLKILAVLIVVAVAALAIAMSHNAACPSGTIPALATGATPMKAAVYRCYGPPEVVKIEDVARPVPADDEVLVRVRAAGINPVEWHYMRGEPYLMRLSAGFGRPKDPRLGVDFSGTVEAVGSRVTKFKPGEAVFGARSGALAEYVTVPESRNVLPKPERITFEQAGGVGVAGVTALQALRDKGQLKPGQRVLINGASGGVGTFAVQIAKALGAEVTGVCSTRNVELVRSIGADHVIDYTAAGLHRRHGTLRPRGGHGRQSLVRRGASRARAGRPIRRGRWHERQPLDRRARDAAQGDAGLAVRETEGHLLHRPDQPRGPRLSRRADVGGEADAGRRPARTRWTTWPRRSATSRTAMPAARSSSRRAGGPRLTARHPLGSNSRPSDARPTGRDRLPWPGSSVGRAAD